MVILQNMPVAIVTNTKNLRPRVVAIDVIVLFLLKRVIVEAFWKLVLASRRHFPFNVSVSACIMFYLKEFSQRFHEI